LTENDSSIHTPVSPVKAGLGCRCPECGKGRLFKGSLADYLALQEQCDHCGLDYSKFDSADGPAVFIILIMGFVVVALALAVEVSFSPPLWLHMILWTPLVIGGSMWLLRPAKGLMIAFQHYYKAEEGKLN